MDARSWYLVQTKPSGHALAQRNLLRQGFEVFLPLQRVTKRKSTRFLDDLRPLFPGYLFVAVAAVSAPWRKINGTFGVSKLVRFGEKPSAVPNELIAALQARCDDGGVMLPPAVLSVGDEVQVLTGPFAHFAATVDSIAADQRVWVLMDLMGQITRVALDADHLQRA